MIKSIKIFARACIILFVVTFVLFLLFIYPRQPLVKILLYHSVLNQENAPDPSIGIDLFNRQMDYVSKHGYEPVFLNTVIQRYKEGKNIPQKWLVLTFDGGYNDFYYNVYPVLKRYKFKATLFVITSCIGGDYITWEQLKEMKKSGLVEIGSHSHSHLPPTCIPLPQAKNEKVMSKVVLEEKLGGRILVYAYPYGAVNNQVKELVKEAGYEGAVGITYRLGEFKFKDIYNLRRIYVSKSSKIPLMFRFMLSGYYVPTRGLVLRLINIKVPRDVGDCSEWQRESSQGV